MNTVLYIEDNISNINLVQNILKRVDGINFIYSQSSKEGLTKVENEDIKLILLDINIPVMNGYQILNEIKKNNRKKNIPVIAITANALPSDVNNLKISGFDDYLIKPFDINKFIYIVENFVNSHSTHQ